MKRIICAVALVGLLASCSSSGQGTGSPATTAAETQATGGSVPTSQGATSSATAAPPDVSKKLLTVADLPTGWAVDNSTGTSTTSGCTKTLHHIVGAADQATISFSQNGNPPELEDEIAYAPAASIKAEFMKAINTVNACKHLSITADGVTLTGPLGQLSYPAVGDQSAAFTASLTAQGTTIVLDIVMLRKGDLLCAVVYTDLDSVDIKDVEPLVTKAVAKLS